MVTKSRAVSKLKKKWTLVLEGEEGKEHIDKNIGLVGGGWGSPDPEAEGPNTHTHTERERERAFRAYPGAPLTRWSEIQKWTIHSPRKKKAMTISVAPNRRPYRISCVA